MKKIMLFIAAIMFLVPTAHAEKIGEVISTDIVTFIDGSPIESYNYEGYTYVIVEELRNYGFDVAWNESERRLDITRKQNNFTPYIADFVNKKPDTQLFVPVFDVYSTDIRTYINGELSNSYNIDGRTIINTDALQKFGRCTYDNSLRRYDVDILIRETEGCEETINEENLPEYNVGTRTIQKGVFSGGKLIYGIRTIESFDKWGKYVKIERGDFAAGKILEYEKNFKRNYEQTCLYKTPERTCYVGFDAGFPYGRYILNEIGADGSARRYLSNGKLYFEGRDDNAMIYKDGNCIYRGAVTKDALKIQTDLHEEEYAVIYAPAYTDADGVIYYYPVEDNFDIAYEFYRGNVVNGVAHGSGTAYARRRSEPNDDIRIVVESADYSSIEWMEKKDTRVIYTGDFADGLPEGYGIIYDHGYMSYSGDLKHGRKHGSGIEFSQWNRQQLYIDYAGGFENGKRSGNGVEYGHTSNGVWLKFDGEWNNNSWHNGRWYELDENGEAELYYEGEFRYNGERQYGTHYKYYNNEIGQYEKKTGWFVDWKLVE